MMSILYVLGGVVLLISTATVCVKQSRKCSVEEAVIEVTMYLVKYIVQPTRWICREVWKALFGNSTLPEEYPTHLGLNGNVLDEVTVEKECTDLIALFKFCRCVSCKIQPSFYAYYFSVILPENISNEDESYKELVQKVAEKNVAEHMRLYGNPGSKDAADLVLTRLFKDHLEVYTARNEAGVQMIADERKKMRRELIEAKRREEGSVVIEEVWEKSDNNRMVWAYDRDIAYDFQMKLPVESELDSHVHSLITGSSGSGKSVALLFLLGKRLQADPDTCIYVCDFKNSADFRFLAKSNYPYYFAGNDCMSGVKKFYERFNAARQSGETGRRFLLVFDEYPAFISRLQMQDKQEKTKKAGEVLNMISEILMLGRGIGYGVWIVTQRADASLFSGGSRDNFMVLLALGRLSREQKGMLFSGEELPDRVYQPGEGVILLDGREVKEVKIPWITDMMGWKKQIVCTLREHFGGNAGSAD